MKVLCVGEMMVDLLVHPVGPVAFDNDASQVEEIAIRSGGDANNNAIDLAKLGNEVYYVGRAGCDVLADYVLDIARKSGVCVDYVKRSSATEQTKSLILIDPSGNRKFLQYPGTSAEFSLDDVDLSLLAAALDTLTPREREIITLRFGLDGRPERTQKEVADRLGISQSYISRLEKRIISRLKREILRML